MGVWDNVGYDPKATMPVITQPGWASSSGVETEKKKAIKENRFQDGLVHQAQEVCAEDIAVLGDE